MISIAYITKGMGIVRPRNLYVRRWTEYVGQEADRSI
jgi:hypothetical protein